MILTGKTEELGQNLSNTVPTGLIPERNRALALRSHLLTTCAMASSIRDSYQGLFKKTAIISRR
jgi:hypothetical protein